MDQGDPNVRSCHGDTPGVLGVSDYGAMCAMPPTLGSLESFDPVSPIGPIEPTPPEQEIAWGKKVSKEFKTRVIEISTDLEVDVNYLMAAMAFESGNTFDAAVKNAAGSGAVGLIQFMPNTAKGMNTTSEALAKLTAVQQLEYVKTYFLPHKGKLGTLEDVYMAILWPQAIGKPDDYVLFDEATRKKTYQQNKGLDSDNDKKITKKEAAAKVRTRLERGMKPENRG